MFSGDTALHSAIRSFDGDISPVKSLLENDADDVNARNAEGETPLILAVRAQRDSSEVITLLLEHGADVRATTPQNGNTALHWLATVEFTTDDLGSDIELLMRHGSDINAINFKGNTPAHLLAKNEDHINNFIGLHVLLQYGCDVDVSNQEGDTPLHLCLQNRETAGFLLLQEFLANAKDVNVTNSKGETILHLVVRRKECCKVKYVKMLLKHGADPSKTDSMGENAYQAYCHALDKDNRKMSPMLRLLLQSNEQRYMNSSLHVACLFHNVSAVHELLKMDADVHATGDFEFPPLFYALNASGDYDKYSTIRLMLDYGVDINHKFTDEDKSETFLFQLGMRLPSGMFNTDEALSLINIFVKHLAKLVALDIKRIERGINIELLNKYNHVLMILCKNRDYVEKYNDWIHRCAKELKAMSQMQVGESRVSFLDLLLASAKETAVYAKNKVLVKAFQKSKSNFPIYQGMLDAKITKELERLRLIERAAVVLSNALNFADPRDEFFERTLSYCSNKDLVHVIISGIDEI